MRRLISLVMAWVVGWVMPLSFPPVEWSPSVRRPEKQA